MFTQELAEYYLHNMGMTKENATKKAFEVREKFANLSNKEIEQLEGFEQEKTLFFGLVTRFEVLESEQLTEQEIDKLSIVQSEKYMEQLQHLTNEEVQAYLYAISRQDGSDSSTITAREYFQGEVLIQTKPDQFLPFLQGAHKFLGFTPKSN